MFICRGHPRVVVLLYSLVFGGLFGHGNLSLSPTMTFYGVTDSSLGMLDLGAVTAVGGIFTCALECLRLAPSCQSFIFDVAASSCHLGSWIWENGTRPSTNQTLFTTWRLFCNSTLGFSFEVNGSDAACTYISRQAAGYLMASETCRAHGGLLVTMKTAAKKQLVVAALEKAQVQSNRLWIGLDDMQEEGNFTWSDGAACTVEQQALIFSKGKPTPTTPDEDCAVIIQASSLVNDLSCTDLYPAICEIL